MKICCESASTSLIHAGCTTKVCDRLDWLVLDSIRLPGRYPLADRAGNVFPWCWVFRQKKRLESQPLLCVKTRFFYYSSRFGSNPEVYNGTNPSPSLDISEQLGDSAKVRHVMLFLTASTIFVQVASSPFLGLPNCTAADYGLFGVIWLILGDLCGPASIAVVPTPSYAIAGSVFFSTHLHPSSFLGSLGYSTKVYLVAFMSAVSRELRGSHLKKQQPA